MEGTVKFFLPEKRFGFISIEGGLDFFFHGRHVIGDIPSAGDTVSFWIDEDRHRGTLEAVEVSVS